MQVGSNEYFRADRRQVRICLRPGVLQHWQQYDVPELRRALECAWIDAVLKHSPVHSDTLRALRKRLASYEVVLLLLEEVVETDRKDVNDSLPHVTHSQVVAEAGLVCPVGHVAHIESVISRH